MTHSPPRLALVAGSFDPITNGHLDVLRQAARIADGLVVAIGVHPGKTPLFSAEDRIAMIEAAAGPLAADAGISLRCVTFSDLVVAAAAREGASLLVRGLRDGADFDYEIQMAGMNATMAPQIQTVFVPASPAFRPISSTLVRQIAAMGGDVAPFVPPAVAARLKERFARHD